MTPQQRSRNWLKKAGYRVATVEQDVRIPARNGKPASMFKRDLFGLGDLLAICFGGIAMIQVTSGSNHATRREKALANDNLEAWLRAGGEFYIHSWRKDAKGKWRLRVECADIDGNNQVYFSACEATQ